VALSTTDSNHAADNQGFRALQYIPKFAIGADTSAMAGKVANGADRVGPAAAFLVQHRLDAFAVDVRPEPLEVLAAV